ncbi:hypothetical protein K439DRAFT_1624738 [Ramaria rubella]|nr:hypothetical protein K439DRAFT_1624738 [Ramaria rubella]
MGERINPKTCSRLIYDNPSLCVTNPIVKHHQLWFSDGAIIAVAAAGTVGFRLHIGFLIYSCATFKEISGTPLSAFSNETFEGCVVIRMRDDESDLINFFLALYNPLSFNFDIKSASNFQKVAGVMRLAHKYGCEVLVTHIRNALFSCYPPSHRLAWHGSLVCSPKAGPSPVQVITLALLCKIEEILPICFYLVAFHVSLESEELHLLGLLDQKRILPGRCALVQRMAGFLASGPPYPLIRCKTGRCAKTLKAFWNACCEDDHELRLLDGSLAKDPLTKLVAMRDKAYTRILTIHMGLPSIGFWTVDTKYFPHVFFETYFLRVL